MNGDPATHAMSNEPAFDDPQVVDQRRDRRGMCLRRIGERVRLVAVAMAEEVDQERAAPAQSGLDGGPQQLPR